MIKKVLFLALIVSNLTVYCVTFNHSLFIAFDNTDQFHYDLSYHRYHLNFGVGWRQRYNYDSLWVDNNTIIDRSSSFTLTNSILIGYDIFTTDDFYFRSYIGPIISQGFSEHFHGTPSEEAGFSGASWGMNAATVVKLMLYKKIGNAFIGISSSIFTFYNKDEFFADSHPSLLIGYIFGKSK